MWAKRKYPRMACIIVTTEESISPRFPETADVELNVGSLDFDQRVQFVGFTPCEPLPQLVGVQVVGQTGVAGQVGNCRLLGSRHGGWLEG